jgi:hypothetical protein
MGVIAIPTEKGLAAMADPFFFLRSDKESEFG